MNDKSSSNNVVHVSVDQSDEVVKKANKRNALVRESLNVAKVTDMTFIDIFGLSVINLDKSGVRN